MQQWTALAVVLLLAAGSQAHPRDARRTFDLLKQGRSLSANDAAKLEERLNQKPSDEEIRIQLLSYYAGPPAGADLPAIKAARSRQILWLIQNDPKDGLGLFQVATGVYRVHCEGDDLADPAAFQLVSNAWMAQVEKNPDSEQIRRSAVNAIQFCDPERAEQILIQAKDLPALGGLDATAALGITGRSYGNSDPAGSDPAFRARPFAEKARRALEEATDKDLLVDAAATLLQEGAVLWADGKLDWDYTPTGNALLAKARNLAPDEMRLVTLPTTLPPRGERPPAMIRVGGNTMLAKLVRQVKPSYPPAARVQGVEGTVQLTAIIGLDGKILYLRADAGPAELIPASLAAVRQWEYKPTTLNGKPCYIETRIDVRFSFSAF